MIRELLDISFQSLKIKMQVLHLLYISITENRIGMKFIYIKNATI